MRTRGRSTSSPGDQLADRLADPADACRRRRARIRASGACDELGRRARRSRRRAPSARPRCKRLGLGARGRRIGGEREAVEPADRVALDHDLAGLVISVSNIVFSRSRRINTLVRRSTKRSVRRSCSASDSLSSTPRATALPMLGIGEPVRTVRHEGPGPDVRDPVRERIDIAIGAVGLRDLARRTSRRGFYPPASGNHRG